VQWVACCTCILARLALSTQLTVRYCWPMRCNALLSE
jgi:hypothetical protein